MLGENRRLPLALGIIVLAVLPYANTLRNGFTFDDGPQVAENTRLRTVAGLGSIWTTDWWWGSRPASLLYRPLTMTTFAIDYAVARTGAVDPPPARLSDAAAVPFHVQNVLWHAAASAAFFFLVLELFGSGALAFMAAALFAVHPVHTEAVDGIVGRAELMSSCFALLSMLLAARIFRGDARAVRRPLIAGFVLLLALLSKEQAIVVPAILAIWLLLRPREQRRDMLGRRSVLVLFAAQAVAVVSYVAMRAAVIGALTGVGATPAGAVNVDNPVASAEGLGRILTPVRVFGEVLRLTLFPRTLSADYSFDQLPVVSSMDGATAFCLAALVALVVFAVMMRRRAPEAAFGILFFLAAWSLTSNLVLVIGTILGERLLYMPVAGACLAVACALLAAGRRLHAPRAAIAAGVALVLVGAGRTWARNPDWKDGLSLFASTVQTSPRSCKAASGYAAELFMRGRTLEAQPWAERALAIDPTYTEAEQTLCKIDRVLARDEHDTAVQAALRAKVRAHASKLVAALSSGTGDRAGVADAWGTLGALALDEGNPAEAEASYRKSLDAKPDTVASINGLGVALSVRAQQETDPQRADALEQEALARFERALVLDPAFAEARQNSAVALRRLAAHSADARQAQELSRRADTDEARAVAVQVERGDMEAQANLHGVLGQRFLEEERYADALTEFREAARLQPTAARAYLGIGSVLAAQDKPDEAIAAFTRAGELEPDNPTVYLDLGIIFLQYRRDPAKVAANFRTYLRLAPDSPMRAQMEQTIREMEGK